MATRTPRAILVEDDDGVRNLLRRVLEANGFQVAAFRDGAPALEQAQFGTADVVITDLAMPTPGEEVIREVRRRGHDVPIVVVTGMLADGGEAHLRQAGATAILRKPILLHELERTIERVLRVRRRDEGDDG